MSKLAQPDERKLLIRKMLIMLGIVILACITLRSALTLILWLVTSTDAVTWWGTDFWSNGFPMIILAAIISVGSFGVYKLIRILRR